MARIETYTILLFYYCKSSSPKIKIKAFKLVRKSNCVVNEKQPVTLGLENASDEEFISRVVTALFLAKMESRLKSFHFFVH